MVKKIKKTEKIDKKDIKMDKGSGVSIREKIYIIIFESDTKAGKNFDLALLWCILISVLIALLESISFVEYKFGTSLRVFEWLFTILFTGEYFFRIYSAKKPVKYIFSFLGLIDLVAIIPTYISIFVVGTQYMIVIRVIRLLRVFRILKLTRYLEEANIIISALKGSIHKITVFLVAILTLITVLGAIMYMVEGPENGFTSIPKSIYWAVVTLTTVGYGDIAPKTGLGQAISGAVMVLGYAIIAIPTGIVSAEVAYSKTRKIVICKGCNKKIIDNDALFCKYCGVEIEKK